ncbi:hypothetical protein [Emticicia fontis]
MANKNTNKTIWKKTARNISIEQLIVSINELIADGKIEGIAQSKIETIKFSVEERRDSLLEDSRLRVESRGVLAADTEIERDLCNGRPIPPRPPIPSDGQCTHVFNRRTCKWEICCGPGCF